jgi:hypothetical protein
MKISMAPGGRCIIEADPGTKENIIAYNKEFAEVVFMLNPPGPLADRASAIEVAFLTDTVCWRK